MIDANKLVFTRATKSELVEVIESLLSSAFMGKFEQPWVDQLRCRRLQRLIIQQEKTPKQHRERMINKEMESLRREGVLNDT